MGARKAIVKGKCQLQNKKFAGTNHYMFSRKMLTKDLHFS